MRTSSPGCSARSPSMVLSARFSAVKGERQFAEPLLVLLLLLLLALEPFGMVSLCGFGCGIRPLIPRSAAPSKGTGFVVELTSDEMCMFLCVFYDIPLTGLQI